VLTLVAVLHVRFADTWGAGVHLVYAAAALAAVLAMAVLAPPEPASPRAYQSILYLASLALAILALGDLADVLGANEPLAGSGTLVWVFGLVSALAFWFAAARDSAICTLAGAVTAGIAVLAFVDWVFDPRGASTFRWILLLLIAAFALAAVAQRDRRPRHGVALVNAGGLACVALGLTIALTALVTVTFGDVRAVTGGAGWGWELVLLAVGWGLIAFSAVEREPGPGYLGAVNLFLFAIIAGPPSLDGASLIGWPLFLAVAGGALLAIALRPTTPAPPSPDAGAPAAPTSPLRRPAPPRR